jgi:hypothetical protein
MQCRGVRIHRRGASLGDLAYLVHQARADWNSLLHALLRLVLLGSPATMTGWAGSIESWFEQVRTGLFPGGRRIRTVGPAERARRPWPVSPRVRADYFSLPEIRLEAT